MRHLLAHDAAAEFLIYSQTILCKSIINYKLGILISLSLIRSVVLKRRRPAAQVIESVQVIDSLFDSQPFLRTSFFPVLMSSPLAIQHFHLSPVSRTISLKSSDPFGDVCQQPHRMDAAITQYVHIVILSF